VAGSFLVYQRQNFKTSQENRESLGSISFQKGDNIGDIKGIDLIFATGDLNSGDKVKISSISVKADIGSVNQNLEFVDGLQKTTSKMVVSENLLKSGEWSFPVNTAYEENGRYYLEFAAVNITPEGFSTIIPVKLGTLFIKTSAVEAPEISLVSGYTKMMSKNKPVIDILP
jgi:hypothetical protein